MLLKQERQVRFNVKTIYTILIFIEKWGLNAGCEDSGLVSGTSTVVVVLVSSRIRVKGLKK